MTEAEEKKLIEAALKARANAYAPYPKFQVGAALLTDSGEIVSGCNVENASYGLAICAERTAICSAIAGGKQKFTAIAVAAHPMATPCGACRQFIAEFGGQIQVITVDAEAPESIKKWRIDELLPERFEFK